MEDFVTFNIAKKLKDKGFQDLCNYYYRIDTGTLFASHKDNWNDDKRCNAPTISQVMKWLRDEKKMYIEICYNYTYYFPIVKLIDCHQTDYVSGRDVYKTYEEAALAGIEYVLDNIL